MSGRPCATMSSTATRYWSSARKLCSRMRSSPRQSFSKSWSEVESMVLFQEMAWRLKWQRPIEDSLTTLYLRRQVPSRRRQVRRKSSDLAFMYMTARLGHIILPSGCYSASDWTNAGGRQGVTRLSVRAVWGIGSTTKKTATQCESSIIYSETTLKILKAREHPCGTNCYVVDNYWGLSDSLPHSDEQSEPARAACKSSRRLIGVCWSAGGKS